MKKINVLLLSLLMTGGVLAQNVESKRTTEERAQIMTENMANQAGLSEEQKAKIETINTQYVADIKAIKADDSKDEEQKKEALKEVRKNWKNSVDAELTEEQREKLKDARADKQKITPEQRAEKKAQYLTKELGLNEEQSQQVLELSLKVANKIEAVKVDNNLSEEQKKEFIKGNRKDFQRALSQILTPEQMSKFEEMKKRSEDNDEDQDQE